LTQLTFDILKTGTQVTPALGNSHKVWFSVPLVFLATSPQTDG